MVDVDETPVPGAPVGDSGLVATAAGIAGQVRLVGGRDAVRVVAAGQRAVEAVIDAACREVLKANKLEDAYMRPLAWRGSEQMGVSAQRTRPHLAIAAWPWGAYFGEEAIAKGLRLDIAKWRRPAPYTAPTGSKASGLYMICTLARHDAQAKGYDDALMFDWRGQVAEGTGANAFFVKDGALHTPTPDCFLDGITRQTVIGLARARGIEVVERAIWPEELEGFEQFFVTGSAAEVTPVAEAGPWRFEVGALSLQLRSDYLDLVNRRIANVPPFDPALNIASEPAR